MQLLLITLGLVLGAAFAAPTQRKRYDGYQQWQVVTENAEQLEHLKLLEGNNKVIFWEEPHFIGEAVELLVHKDAVKEFTKNVINTGAKATLLEEDIQKQLDADWARLDARHARESLYDYDEDDYNTYDDIMSHLDTLLTRCNRARLTCELDTIGQSYEGRPLKVLRLSSDPARNHPVVWMDSLIHAREWLAGATNMRMLSHMIENYGTDETVTRLVNKYDWHVLPVHNPDGYTYSWTNDRFWRRSRNPNSGSSCLGTDLNRNYDWLWGGAGTSSNPCSQTYKGSFAGSEPETQAVQDEAKKLGDRAIVWFTIHTAANAWLLPWGHLTNGRCTYPEDDDDLNQANDAAIDAIEKTWNTSWRGGNSCAVLYATTGTTADYVKAVAGIKYTVTPELRGPGFNPSASNIQPSFLETWNGVVAFMDEVEEIESRK